MQATQLASIARHPAAGLREKLQAGRQELRERYAQDGKAQRLLLQHRLLMDRILRELWKQAALPGSLTLAAVGTVSVDQFSASDQLFVSPPPSQIITLERKIG